MASDRATEDGTDEYASVTRNLGKERDARRLKKRSQRCHTLDRIMVMPSLAMSLPLYWGVLAKGRPKCAELWRGLAPNRGIAEYS